MDTIHYMHSGVLTSREPKAPEDSLTQLKVFTKTKCTMYRQIQLKEYYEIVDEEARSLSGFVPTHAFLIMKLTSFKVTRALIASQSTFE